MTEKIIKFGLLIERIYAGKGKYKIFLLLKFNFKIYREKYYLSLSFQSGQEISFIHSYLSYTFRLLYYITEFSPRVK